MAVSFDLKGGAELSAALRGLGDEVSKRIIRGAVVAGSAVIRKRAKEIAAAKGLKQTGALIANIAHKRERPTKEGYAQVNIGVRHGQSRDEKRRARKKGEAPKDVNDPFYWRFAEFGTSKQAATPFIRPAFEESKEKAVDAMVERTRRGIAAQAKKAGLRVE